MQRTRSILLVALSAAAVSGILPTSLWSVEAQDVYPVYGGYGGRAPRANLLLSNEYYRQPYRPPGSIRHYERDHHERDILRTPYEPLRQYEREYYRLRPSAFRNFEDAGNPADYFRDRYGRPLAEEGRSRSQFLAAATVPRVSADLRVAQQAEQHGYHDSVPYHTAGNRRFTDTDGQAQYRNFELNGPNHARYTVRTGSDPTAQDGPIVAFAASPSRDRPAKLYVRDVPIYF